MNTKTLEPTKIETESKKKNDLPKIWQVVLCAQDCCPNDFVCDVLKKVFRLDAEDACAKLDEAVNTGRSIVFSGVHEICEQKANDSNDMLDGAEGCCMSSPPKYYFALESI